MSKRKILCQECPIYKDGLCPHKSSRVSPDDEACAFGKRERRRVYHKEYRLKWNKERGIEPVVYQPRTCAICGAEFEPHRANQRYCSTECQAVGRTKHESARIRDFTSENARRKVAREREHARMSLKARLAARDSEYARQFPKDGDMAATTRGRIPGGYSHAVNKSGLTVAV